ncbi:hypothetical protein CI1B_58980 [Bradyrhizobium ivorense]|uniref:Uncharacterized protein n=1 Tax=Bradyrhizobium ivorense TaxID=2511166 RepID=A0A508TMB9_9BRAD|nr:hypothetical protein [Bradyrhizobium ivorense]VIO75393.1 hypothetical protein CI1B_58980 [Bradyrhizobium ivorense]
MTAHAGKREQAYAAGMKRFLAFALIGPFITIALLTAYIVVRSGTTNPALVAAGFVASAYLAKKLFVFLTSLAAWLGDVVLVHWRVELLKRILVIGGGVTVLTAGLETFSTAVLVIGLICGSIAALCVWLSDHEERGKQES